MDNLLESLQVILEMQTYGQNITYTQDMHLVKAFLKYSSTYAGMTVAIAFDIVVAPKLTPLQNN